MDYEDLKEKNSELSGVEKDFDILKNENEELKTQLKDYNALKQQNEQLVTFRNNNEKEIVASKKYFQEENQKLSNENKQLKHMSNHQQKKA